MPPLTLNQAAKEAGKSKQTILDAIRNGRLSAPKDEQGRYQIDPAELFRVYPVTGQQTSQRPDAETGTDHPRPDTGTAFFERIIAGLESERDDLRRRLDAETDAREKSADDVRRLTLILTHQPSTDTQPVPATETAPVVRPSVWFGVRSSVWFAIVAAIAAATWPFWLPYWTGKN